MNAKEARELALWNKLPNIIRNRIKEAVDNGLFEEVFYKTVNHPLCIDWDRVADYIEYLKFLGYSVEIISIKEINDERLRISWK